MVWVLRFMPRYKIVFDRDACIGAFACEGVAPKFWIPAKDGKVDLKNAKKNPQTGKYELIVETEKDFNENLTAAEVCPVTVIKIINLDTGEEII